MNSHQKMAALLRDQLQAGADLRVPIMDALHARGIDPSLATLFGLLWVSMYLHDELGVMHDDQAFLRTVAAMLRTHRTATEKDSGG